MTETPTFLQPAHQAPWFRLYRDGRPVGFKKFMGERPMYGQGGSRWTGEEIPHDAALPQLPLRDQQGERLFHGDVIQFVGGDGTLRDCVALLDHEGRVSLLDERGHPCWSASTSDSEGPPAVRAAVGSIYGSIAVAKRFDAVMRTVELAGRFSHLDSLMCTVWGTGAALLAFAIQFWLLGSFGLLICGLGFFIGIVLYCLRRRRRDGGWLMRSRILRMAPRVGLYFGFVLALTYGVLATMGVSGLALPEAGLTVPMVCAGIFGFFLGFGGMIIGGDMAAHMTGGHATDKYGGPRGMSY
ncbi:MAG: hypothetical protein VX589_08090 [Myxococcota bacterium]|nr:hypothetical protein [Myxococcota bacterium]